jgi:ABC-type phosphate transport system substrate-binding protein
MSSFVRLSGFAVLLALAGLSPAHAAESDTAIAVIVAASHGKNPKIEDVALIYRRKKLFWADGTKVNPVNLASTHPLRRLFSQAVLGASPEDLEKYWNNMYFHGVSPPFVLSSEEAVLRFVALTPGAIGYVSYCSVDSRVKVALVFTASGPVSEDVAKAACEK